MSKPDFQTTFGFAQELQSTTQREIGKVMRANRRGGVVAVVCGALMVTVGLEMISTPLQDHYEKYGRVYRCNWEMLRRSRRLQAVQRYMQEEVQAKEVNQYYHKHLVERVADLCMREAATPKPHFSPAEAWKTLALIADFYRSNSKSAHLHAPLLSATEALVRIALAHAEILPWTALWSVFNLLLQEETSKTETLYLLQTCLEASSTVICDPPPSLLPQVLSSLHSPHLTEIQAAKDLLTLLLLKCPACLLPALKPALTSTTEQDRFLLTYWPSI
jgi:hypothetical protein